MIFGISRRRVDVSVTVVTLPVMNRRLASAWLACCALAIAASRAQAADVSVYGLELEVSAERERLLIFADAPLSPQLLPVDERTVMIALPGAVLDSSAPTQIVPKLQGTVTRVTAFERAQGAREVRVVVQRRPGAEPRIEQRASVIAVDFDPLPRGAAGGPDTIRVAYQNAPITQVVTDLARATGESLVYDESAAALGSVTIEGPGQVTRGEALALIDSLLLLRGFAAVPGPGGVRKIVPISGAPSAWSPSGRIPDSDAPITTMLRLENAVATELVPILTPYLGSSGFAAAYEPTNSLILSGAASLLRTLRTAIDALDENVTGAPLIWPMRVASAETVADQLLAIAGERDIPFVSHDARRNALLLRVRPGETERVRALVDRLDRPARGAGRVQVLKLRYADAAELAERLIALRDSGAGSAEDAATARAGLRGLAFEAVADEPTHSLVLSGPPDVLSAVLDVVSELDRVPPSVRVEVTVAMVDLDELIEIGTDYFIPTLSNPKEPDDLIASVLGNPSGGGVPLTPSAERPFIAAFTRAPLLTFVDPSTGQTITIPLGEQVSVSLNGRSVDTRTLQRPNLLITAGDEHEIFAGDNIPIPVGSSGGGTTQSGVVGEDTTGGTTTNPLVVQQNIERQDVGTSLRITPTVGDQGGVMLELRVEVSSLSASTVGDVEEVGPTIRQVIVESAIRLRSGEIAVIGSAARPTIVRNETGVPWLKDLPILGWAFRFTSEERRKSHLLIAARAEILRPEASRELADGLSRALGAPAAPAANAAP